MSSFLSTENDLTEFTVIWLRILLWAFVTSVVVYAIGGVCSAVIWRRAKSVAFICPIVYLLYGAVKFVTADLITCLLIAAIYVTASWDMSGLGAFGWGIGLSLASTTLNAVDTNFIASIKKKLNRNGLQMLV